MLASVQRAFARALILLAALTVPAAAQFGVPAPTAPAIAPCLPFGGFPMALNLGSANLLGLDGLTSRCAFQQVQGALNMRGKANGLASLDQNGLLPVAQLPPISLNLPSGGSLPRLSLAADLALGGPEGVAPTLAGLGYQIYGRRYATGTTDKGVNLSLFNVEGDTATVTGPNFLNTFAVQSSFGGSTVQGGRQGLQVILNQIAPTSQLNLNRNYVGGTFIAQTSTGDGGTGLYYDPTGLTPNQAQGGIFGINPVCILDAGATNVLNCSAGEVNIAARAGSSVAYKSGVQISSLGSDQVQGASVDAMISLSNQFGAVGWRDGILFGPQNGSHPIAASGYLLRSFGPGRATVGLSTLGVLTSSNYAGTGARPLYAAADGTFQTLGSNTPPASATTPCQVGATAYTPAFFYACVATNLWARSAATTTWP